MRSVERPGPRPSWYANRKRQTRRGAKPNRRRRALKKLGADHLSRLDVHQRRVPSLAFRTPTIEKSPMSCSESAVLLVTGASEAPNGAKSLVREGGAGKEIRTPDLLITSDPRPSAVLPPAPRSGRRVAAERQRPSYRLPLRPLLGRPRERNGRAFTVDAACVGFFGRLVWREGPDGVVRPVPPARRPEILPSR
jgi:hypothetical protein